MRGESGMSLAEITIVMVLAAMLITATVTYAIPWLGREEMRGAVYETQQFLQLARIQAVTRDRSSRFLIDTGSRRIQVFDLNDPTDTTDDILLYDTTLPKSVSFVRPDGGSAVTLESVSSSLYRSTFAADGSVSAGAGQIGFQGGDGNYLLTLYGAGGVRVERWNGSAWVAGS